MPIDASLFFLCCLIFVLTGTIKGLVGIGLPTASIAILSQFTDTRQAIALTLVPVLLSNIWQLYRSKMFWEMVRRFWLFAVTSAGLIIVATQFAERLENQTLTLLVGFVIILFVVTSLTTRKMLLPEKYDRPAQFLGGAIAGLMGGITTLWSPPLTIYLTSKNLEKEEMVAAFGFLITFGALPLTIAYLQAGLTTPELSLVSAVLFLPTLIGFSIGEYLRKYLSTQQFRNLLLIVFFLLGANLIRTALMAG